MQWPWQRVPLNWKAKVGAREVAYSRQFEQNIAFVRYQDDVLVTIDETGYLQACGSAVLVFRTADKHEKGHAETEI